MNAVKCGKNHGYHKSVADVRACYNGEEVDFVNVGRTPGGADAATSKQVSYARDGASLAPNKPANYTDPRAHAHFDPQTLEDGFYVLNGVVYKVIVAVHGSGRKYAKQLQSDGSWDRAPGLLRRLRPENKMTLAQAMETAKRYATDMSSELYGRCFVCGRTLTDEESIAANIGPVCAGRFA